MKFTIFCSNLHNSLPVIPFTMLNYSLNLCIVRNTNVKNKIGWIVLIVVSSVIGLGQGYYMVVRDYGFWWLILVNFCFLGSSFIHIIIHEVGHLIAGYISGYHFIMFRLLNVVWIKTENGVELRKQQVSGILGQALMVPPKDSENPPFKLYHLGGVLLNGITAFFLTILVLYIENQLVREILIAIAMMGGALALLNVIPYGINDGANVKRAWNDNLQQKQFQYTLKIYEGMVQGEEIKDLLKFVFIDERYPLSDGGNTTMQTLKAAYYMEQFQFEKALELYQPLWEVLDKLIGPHQPEIIQNYLFLLILTDPTSSDITKILEDKRFKALRNLKQADMKRLLAAYSINVEKDWGKASEQLLEARKLLDRSPTLTDQQLEEKLIDYLEKELIARTAAIQG